MRALRTDAQRDCRPVRSDLPPRATAGIECVLGTALVDRVGVYGFDFDDQAAGLAYLERMDRAGTLGSTGDCLAGTPGDFGYDGADPEEWAWTVTYQGHDYSTSRYGCFLNDQGFANFRATCGHVYVGVLGNGKRLDELTAWALKAPPGEISGQGPGLCFGELGGGLDGGS